MQISGAELMPKMNSTNTGHIGAYSINKEARFQAELDQAHRRINQAAKSGVMTPEQLAQRDKDIKDASVQLEAIMLKMLYGEMWKTVPKDSLYGDDNAMDIYRDMYHEELTKKMAMDGGIGLSEYIYQQLTQTKK